MFARLLFKSLTLAAMLNSSAPGRVDDSNQPQPSSPIEATDPRPLNVQDEVFYHIMPIAWRYSAPTKADAEAPQNKYRFGNFKGIQDGLPYLKSLGVTAIWLNPIFPSAAYHGYQHGPADQINPWFGTEADFRALVNAAHAQGVKVFLDLVVYGISQNSIYFKSSVNNPASGYAPMLAYTDERNTKFIGYDFKTWTGDKIGFINWDLRRASARRLVFEWSKKWLDPDTAGIDGYRLDHVWQTCDKGADGLGYNIDTFWKEWRAEIESANPRVFTFAEQNDWNSFGAELLRTTKGERVHDAAFTKPFESAARDALKEETAAKLYLSAAATLTACPDGYTFLGIIGTHDVDRVASAIGADDHPGRAKAAAAVLMLQPFPPIIYYGDELGMLGKGANFDSDASDIPRREPMKWNANADESSVMTNYYALHTAAYVARYSKDADGKSVEEQDGDRDSLLNTYRGLASERKRYTALRAGKYVPLKCDAPGVWAFIKQHKSGDVFVAINLSAQSSRFKLESPAAQVSMRGLPIELIVKPYGYVVLPVQK